MSSELTYKDLSEWVYFLDGKHEQHFYMEVGDVRKFGGVKYEILKIEDNTSNGMQAMAVAPVKNKIVDTSEIVIAYAGTNPGDNLDIRTDIQTVIVGSKQLDTSTPIKPADSLIDGQVITAEKFAEAVKNDYPDAVMTTTGHSLGEFLALYVAAENGWKNVGFNGPDPYKILSDDAKVWVAENSGMLFNYRNKKDWLLGNHGGNGTGAEILIDMDMSVPIKDTLKFESHNLSTWEFDEKGRLIIKDTYANKDARLVQAEKIMYTRMIELATLAKKLKASGGGLSRSEEVFLNDTEALIAIESASNSMKIGLEYVIKVYQDAILEVEEIWTEGIQRAKLIGTELSYYEIIDALAAGGATKYAIVNKPTAEYQAKIAKAKQIGESFNQLATEIKSSIKKVKDTDEDLARQISQGV
ncbi:lipase [Sporosarcina jiandibaonis]|uniref:lipase n=1 Tax=Sporosarcina jiandibaonis TaxID=2715535 RepID=UPI0015532048|nr:lipase [Sporosarcina jiandibaonis]